MSGGYQDKFYLLQSSFSIAFNLRERKDLDAVTSRPRLIIGTAPSFKKISVVFACSQHSKADILGLEFDPLY